MNITDLVSYNGSKKRKEMVNYVESCFQHGSKSPKVLVAQVSKTQLAELVQSDTSWSHDQQVLTATVSCVAPATIKKNVVKIPTVIFITQES